MAEIKINALTFAFAFPFTLALSMLWFGVLGLDFITALNTVALSTWFWIFAVSSLLDIGILFGIFFVLMLILR
jgi:hypothetical protein